MNLPKKSNLKIFKVVKISGIVLGSTAALLYVLPFLFKDVVSEAVSKITKEYVKSEVDFKELNISFFTHFPNLTVGLEDSKIAASSVFPNQNIIKANEIALGIDLFSLLGEKISFNRLYLSDAVVNIKSDSLGNSNYDILISNDETPKDDSSVNLEFEKIIIKNTNIVFEDQKNKIAFKANNLNYNGSISFIENILALEANTKIQEVFFTFDNNVYIDKKELSGNLNTEINLDKLSLNFKKNALTLAKFPFEIVGGINLPENDIDFNLTILSRQNQLSDLFSIVPPAYQEWYRDTKIEGTSSFEFSLKGKMNTDLNLNPTMQLKLSVSEGLVNYQNSAHPIKNLNIKSNIILPDLNPEKIDVQISDFNFNLADGFAKGNLNFVSPLTVQAQLQTKLNLAYLKEAAGLSAFDMKGFLDIQATVDGSYQTDVKKVGIRGKEQSYIASIPKINLKSKLTDGYFKMKDLPLAVEQIFADLEILNTDEILENTSINFSQIKAKAGDNFINGFVQIENLYNYKLNTNLKADLNLADLTSIYPVESFNVKGDLFIDFKANGTYEPNKNIFPVSDSYVKLDNGFLQYTDIPELPIEEIDVELKVSSSKGSINDLRVEVLPISFKLAGEEFKIDADLYNFNNLTYKINSKGTLDLNKIYQVFAIKGYNVNGLIKADMNVFGRGNSSDPATVRNRGFIDLHNIYLDAELFPNSFIIQDGKLKFQREKIILDNINVKYASNNFKVTGSLSNYVNFALKENALLSGNVNIETTKINIDDFMAFNSNPATVSNASKKSSSSGVILIPENFNIGLNAVAKQVYFEGIKLTDFKGNLSLDKGKVLLNDTKFNLIGSSFGMNGSYQPISPRMAKFSYTIQAKDFDIQKAYNEITIFRELASAAKNVFGTVSLDYSLSGVLNDDMKPKMKSIEGGGVLTLEDIQFKGFKLFNAVSEETSFEALHDAKTSKIDIKTTIKNNVITIEPTKFKIGWFRPKIQGQVTLDGRMNLGFRLGLPPFGIIGIPIAITGTSDDMKLKLGQQSEEPLEESDADYENYKKSLEEVQATDESE